MPTSRRSPHVNQGHMRLGPAVIRTFPLASPRSQVRACFGPGGYCRRLGNGGTQTCLPAAHGVAPPVALYGMSSPVKHSRSSRGAKPREADDARPPRGRPHQDGSRGAERPRRGAPCEVPMTQAMTTETRRALACAVSSFPLWC